MRLPATANLSNFSTSTVVNRDTNLKIQDMDTLYAQSDYQTKFKAWGVQHELLAGVDVANETKTVYGARTAAQGGVVPVKPSTTIGTPNDGASVVEASRILRTTSDYESTGWGTYVQDMVQVAPHWKLLAGLRYDKLSGDYTSYNLSATKPAPAARRKPRDYGAYRHVPQPVAHVGRYMSTPAKLPGQPWRCRLRWPMRKFLPVW